jgi:hypothetical protein
MLMAAVVLAAIVPLVGVLYHLNPYVQVVAGGESNSSDVSVRAIQFR